MNRLLKACALGFAAAVATSALAAAEAPATKAEKVEAEKPASKSVQKNFRCKKAPDPVLSLSFGSRYTDESENRSDIDAEANAAVNKALKPIDQFISRLSRMANEALLDRADSQKRGECVVDWLLTWAQADALSGLDTSSANLAMPARFAGLAFAYRQARSAAVVDEAAGDRIETWLAARARVVVTFFDNEAPPKASRNNLRLWAGLAATEIGVATGQADLVDWGAASNELVACQADADGSLPLEMGRGRLALHYQLHAVAPMVLIATALEEQGRAGFAICDGKIGKVVDFTLAAVEDPTIVDKIAGETQTFTAGQETIVGHQMAWAEPYLSRFDDPRLNDFVAGLRPLIHAKLGGNLTQIYGD